MAEPQGRLVAGRYRLLARLGQGGMGVVWRAHDELLRRDVAVKELHLRVPVGDEGDVAGQRLLREARAAARLRHPGVVAVYDVVVDGGHPLIVMELVEGRSLAEVIRADGPLPEDQVAALGWQVSRALEVAHQHGIVHRDVKPANILLDGDRVVLTDFGIAAVAGDTTLTDGRAVLGSPEYLAPERVNGKPAAPATDLWSLGVTLCAAVRGESPFQRADTQATLAAVLTYEPPPIPHAPRLWPVLAKLLRKDPERRPTAAAAGKALAGVAWPGRGRADVPTGPVAYGEAPARRVGRRLAIVLAVLVLAVATSVWLVARSGRNVADGTGGRPATTTAAPPGFTVHRDDGFTILMPKEWIKDSTGFDAYWASSFNKKQTLMAFVESWEQGRGEALDMLEEFEEAEFESIDFISQYHRVSLTEAAAPSGMTAADLEVTYHVSREEGEFDVHELLRAVVADDGRTFLLTVAAQDGDPAATEQLWQGNDATLTTIVDSFHVIP